MKLLATVLSLFLLAGCTDQTQSSLGATVAMGDTPNDICIIDGIPQIIGVSIENEGDIDFSYFTRDQIVNQKYGTGLMGVTTRKQGRLEWTLLSPLNCD